MCICSAKTIREHSGRTVLFISRAVKISVFWFSKKIILCCIAVSSNALQSGRALLLHFKCLHVFISQQTQPRKKMAHKARRSRRQGILFLIKMNSMYDLTEREEHWRYVIILPECCQNEVRCTLLMCVCTVWMYVDTERF